MIYSKLIDDLIEFNLNHREKYQGHKLCCSPVAYAMEFCTIRCDVGRQVGKTKYIKDRAGDGDLVIVANENMKHLFMNDMCGHPMVMTPRDIHHGPSNDIRFSRIFIDEPRMVFKHISQDELYTILCHGGEQTFILLGR